MPNKEFLETYSLYRTFKTNYPNNTLLININKPAIHMHCDVCESEQTFNMVNQYGELESDGQYAIANGIIVRARYTCESCQNFFRVFFIQFLTHTGEEDGKQFKRLAFRKVGQAPAWEISADKALSKQLGAHLENYKKGLTCESQSYGIGAYSYFRRVTEDLIDELLESIAHLIDAKEKGKYEEALANVRKATIAEEKIKLAKDLLPESLRPEGYNPLGILYSALSAGIHEKSEEECLDLAEEIKKVLIYLVNQVIKQKKEAQEFTEGMRKILEKNKKK